MSYHGGMIPALYAAALSCGLLVLLSALKIALRTRARLPRRFLAMAAGMVLFIAQAFLESLGGAPAPLASGLGVLGLVVFCAGAPAFSQEFFGRPLPRAGRAVRILCLCGACAVAAASAATGRVPTAAAALVLYGTLGWIVAEGAVSVARGEKGPLRRARLATTAATGAFLPFFVLDSLAAGSMVAPPLFVLAAAVAGLFLLVRRVLDAAERPASAGLVGTDIGADGIGAADLVAAELGAAELGARFGLSGREADVAALLCAGASNARIAEELFISVKTVETHLSRIYRKAGVDSRLAFSAKARPRGSGKTPIARD